METANYTMRAEVPKTVKVAAVRKRLEGYSAHLEAARKYFGTLVEGKSERAMKPVVYFFAGAEGYYLYSDFTQEDRLEHTSGCYLPAYRQLLFFEDESEAETQATLTHEAFHEYLDSVAPGVPVWLSEGMAEYAAGIEVRNGEVVSRGGVIRGRLLALQDALAAGWRGFPFDRILRESRERFYEVQPERQYAQAWSMVHFFRHHAGGKHAPLLDRYVKSLVKGTPTSEAYAQTFGKQDLEGMRKEWSAYVRGLK